MRPLSPIALVTVVTAAVAVAVVAVVQGENAGRPRVEDARAVRSDGALHLNLTIVNDGDDDRLVGVDSPFAAELSIASGSDRDAPSAAVDIALPAGSAVTLDAESRVIVARGVDWDRLPDGGLPLLLDFARSDALYVVVPLAAAGD